MVIGYEVGEQGTAHVQGYCQFKKQRRYGPLAARWHAHCEAARGTPTEASDYCKKDGNFEEIGELQEGGRQGGQLEKKRWEDARVAAREGRMDDIPADIYIRHYGNLHRIFMDAMPKPPDLDALKNRWVYGPTGVGKSYGVRRRYGQSLFNKPKNKWWDGYNGEDTVLIEEVDPNDATWMAAFLKTWGDHYSFVAECKGRSRCLRPKRIVVTSNYSIEQVFESKPYEVEPLRRRYREMRVARWVEEESTWELA